MKIAFAEADKCGEFLVDITEFSLSLRTRIKLNMRLDPAQRENEMIEQVAKEVSDLVKVKLKMHIHGMKH